MNHNTNDLNKQENILNEERSHDLEGDYLDQLPEGFFFANGNLMFQVESEEGKEPNPPTFVCSKLDIVALTRDTEGNNQGRLLEFHDADRLLKQWAMPMELLAGDGIAYRAELLSMGLRIGFGKNAKSLLSRYILSSLPKTRAICVKNTGWHNKCFVLPDQILGESKELLLLQSLAPIQNAYTEKGSLEEWRQHVAVPCRSNSRLILALSAAFAAPLLHWLESESGGFHFFGPSSSGKTTALKVAASVWGGKEYLQRWRSTINGLEALATVHNDSLLCLDELGQIEPRQAGEAAYLLAHGTGKTRANQLGLSRKKNFWRLLFLSTGETGLAQHMLEAGKKIRAGQEVRILEIPADTGKYGIFEELHHHENGKTFAEALEKASQHYHGVAGRIFLTTFLRFMDTTLTQTKRVIKDFIEQYHPQSADGQVGRALNRFALIAAAGEVASSFDITGWNRGEAIQAAVYCFHAWLLARGGIGPQEERAILSQVRHFFEQHGESRFTPWDAHPEHKTLNRAGFRKREIDGEMEFYVLPETFKTEICAGLDPTQVSKVCAQKGLLKLNASGGYTRSERLPGNNRTTRCYRFTSHVLGEE